MNQIFCPDCGLIDLTEEEFTQQLLQPSARWTCPDCGNVAEFIDNDEESELDDEQE